MKKALYFRRRFKALAFDEFVDLGEASDHTVSAVSLPDVQAGGEEPVGRLGVHHGHGHTGLGREER